MKLKTNLVLTSIALALGALSASGQTAATTAPAPEPVSKNPVPVIKKRGRPAGSKNQPATEPAQ